MSVSVSRRQFVGTGSIGALGGLLLGNTFADAQSAPAADSEPDRVRKMIAEQRRQKGDVIEQRLVEDLVFHAHSDLDQVKAIVADHPRIVNCTMDWGGGDYETALGAAAHMGRRDIAIHLLENQARLDLFAAAMLGHLDIVKAAVGAFPNIVEVPGPHGIPLLVHAMKGGPEAEAVRKFLEPLARG